jgi:CRISPR/Cas system CSM-associated protein Csm4 (group 5 of RAMP superfamily)
VDFIYHSDSLYSAVTSAMARLGSLDAWLDATARRGEGAPPPAVCFSSCFPFLDEIGFVVPPRTAWPPVSRAVVSARVRWKSARFVPLGVVQAILSGQRLDENHWSVDGASECLVPVGRPGPFRTGVRWSAAVDRLTGSTERHSTACIEFRPGAGLWTIVSFVDDAAHARWLEPVKAAFRLLADTGFGGERSRGWGRADSPEFIDGTLPDMILPPREPAGQAVEQPEQTATGVTLPSEGAAEPIVTAQPERLEAAAPGLSTEEMASPVSDQPGPSGEPAAGPDAISPVSAASAEPTAEPDAIPPVSAASDGPTAEPLLLEQREPSETAASDLPTERADEPVSNHHEPSLDEPAEDPVPAAPVTEPPSDQPPIEEPPAEPSEPTEGMAAVRASSDLAPLASDPSPLPPAEPEPPVSDPAPLALEAAPSTTEPIPPLPEPEPAIEEAAEAVSPIAEPSAAQPVSPAAGPDSSAPEPVSSPAPGPWPPAPESQAPTPSPQPPTPVLPGHPHWLLSLFTPAPADAVDWRRGNYTVLARGGRVDSPAGSGELKKQLQMVAEGSVVYAPTGPCGTAADVAPDGFAHPVFRAGFAVSIPLPEVS